MLETSCKALQTAQQKTLLMSFHSNGLIFGFYPRIRKVKTTLYSIINNTTEALTVRASSSGLKVGSNLHSLINMPALRESPLGVLNRCSGREVRSGCLKLDHL